MTLSPVRTNYVLIDFESVQKNALEKLTDDCFKVVVFVGAGQDRLRFEIVESLQQLCCRAEYIKISSTGPNALDFHIAYYIGRLAVAEPSAYFHIISKDTGFDPLIQHLRSKKILAGRVESIADIPLVKRSEHLAIVLKRLQQLNGEKPDTEKKLKKMLASLFQNKLPETEVGWLVHILKKQGHLEVVRANVTYTLPTDGLS